MRHLISAIAASTLTLTSLAPAGAKTTQAQKTPLSARSSAEVQRLARSIKAHKITGNTTVGNSDNNLVVATSVSDTSVRDRFVQNLLSQMTLEEKIGQLNQFTADMDQTGSTLRPTYREDIRQGRVGSILNGYGPAFINELQRLAVEETRMKIPLLTGYDVIHGHHTIFPIPLGEASSWDLPLMEETARIAAREAAADGIHWTFSPMVDVARDPRWGRVAEGAGEDPWLGSLIGAAKVRGYQGSSFSDPSTVLACVKHFAFYGAPGGGRDYNTVDMSRRAMFETYLPPYRAALNAGAATVMTSFNEVDGVPATGNLWLLRDLLREHLQFKGLLVTDYSAISEMINHGVAADNEQATVLAIRAGVDMDMQSVAYLNHLARLVRSGTVPMQQVDEAARRILNIKYDLGLFQDPYRGVTEERARQTHLHPSHLATAREVGRQSIVLLKNENSVLPLKQGSRIALVGPLVRNTRDLIGNWSAAGDWWSAVTVEAGLNAKSLTARRNGGGFEIQYEKGANLLEDRNLLQRLNDHGAMIEIDPRSPAKMIEDAIEIAEDADVVVAVLGEPQAMSGEAASRADIGLPANQVELLKALKQTGKPVVLVLMNGRPLTLEWEHQNMAAILETWYLGSQAGNAIADVLVGDYNPSGKLTMSFPRHVGQIPVYYASKNTGRPVDPKVKYTSKYLDVPNDPLYPFGFGLSYTTFVYGDLALSQNVLSKSSHNVVQVSLPVTNSGSRAGTEIVQLYIRDMVASVTRPVKELRGFKKINLEPGETKTVSFNVTIEDLKFYNETLEKVAEPGEFRLMVGPNSAELKEVSFTLAE
jgi:beta-glucosidase